MLDSKRKKMKTVCMIPVRANSKRIPKKNLRLLNGIPLVAYAIKAAKESHVFDEIWVNSENEIFKELADEYGVKFYKRPEEYATDQSTNDDFMYDFLRHVDCDKVVQLLCTSPFITPQEVRDFYFMFKDNPFDTLISVKDVRIECLYNGKALNFSRTAHTKPSQELIPVQAYGCSLMAWDRNVFVRNYETSTGAYHGGSGKTGYYTLGGNSTIDIDTEDDFQLAEMVAKSLSAAKKEPEYYHPGMLNEHSESDVPQILVKDGIKNNFLSESNRIVQNIEYIISQSPTNEDWSFCFIDTESNRMTAISQMKGNGNRSHKHDQWNEWWYIHRGKWKVFFDDDERIVCAGDVVFIEKGKWHRIESLEDNSIRFAVSRSDVAHIYKED